MPRPSIEENVRNAVRNYLLIAERLSSTQAPLNTVAVAKRLNFNRKTLKKYRLDEEIAAASERQARNAKLPPKESEWRSINEILRNRDQEIDAMRRRCEVLISQVCMAEGNAQRLGIDPAELWRPLLKPDRSVPHMGGRL